MLARNFHRKGLFTQAVAIAGATGAVVLVAFEFFANPVAVGLAVAALHIGNDALKHAGNLIDASAFIIAEGNFLFARAIKKHLLHMGREVFPLGVFVKLVMFGNRLDGLEEIGRLALAPWGERAIIDFESAVRDNEVFVKEKLNTEAVTVRACAEGRVEREEARLDLGDGEARHRTSELLRKSVALRLALARSCFKNRDTISEVERCAQAIRKACFHAFADHDPVDHNVDVMAEFLVKRGRLVELIEFSVNLYTLKALFAQLKKLFLILSLTVTNDRGEQVAARALFHRHDPIHHILHLLRLDGQACGGRVRRACARKEKTQVIINLGDRAHGRARVFACGLLLNGNGGAKAADVVDIGLFHHIKKLAGIGRKALNITALAFGIDRVERERRFARARQASDHHELIPRDININRFEIVLARAAHFDVFEFGHACPCLL